MTQKKLKKDISTIGLLFIAVGSMIGSGWLFGSLYAAKAAGPAAILAWVIAAFCALLIAFVYAELGAALPCAGGLSRYPNLTHGHFSGIAFSWIAFLAYVTIAPIEVQAVLEYAATYYPALTYLDHGSVELSTLGLFSAAGLLFFFCLLNMWGVKFLVETNNVVVWWKILIPSLTIVTLLLVRFEPQNFTAQGGFFSKGIQGVLAAISTAGVMMSYAGFRTVIEMAGEVKNPHRAIPIALIGAIVICMIIYLGLQIAFIGALGPQDLSNGWHHITFKDMDGPFAGLAIGLGVGWLAKILFADALIAPSGTALIFTTATSRLTYAMGEKGFFPKLFTKLNKHNIPFWGLLINYAIGLILLLPFPGWSEMVGFVSAAGTLSFSSGPAVLLALRKQKPLLKRPFKIAGATWVAGLAFIISNYITYWTGWKTLSMLLPLVLGGIFVMLLFNRIQLGKSFPLHFKSGIWILILVTGLYLLSYLGSFGGGTKILPFGWDLLVVGIFALVLFVIAVWSGLNKKEMEKMKDF